MDNSELLDLSGEKVSSQKPNALLNVMCILGYVGNGIFLLIGIGFLALGNDIISQMFPTQNGDLENIKTILSYVFLVIIIISGLSIFGLILAHQKKKTGVIIYGIANGLWAVINLISLQPNNLIIAVISFAFIIVIALNYKK